MVERPDRRSLPVIFSLGLAVDVASIMAAQVGVTWTVLSAAVFAPAYSLAATRTPRSRSLAAIAAAAYILIPFTVLPLASVASVLLCVYLAMRVLRLRRIEKRYPSGRVVVSGSAIVLLHYGLPIASLYTFALFTMTVPNGPRLAIACSLGVSIGFAIFYWFVGRRMYRIVSLSDRIEASRHFRKSQIRYETVSDIRSDGSLLSITLRTPCVFGDTLSCPLPFAWPFSRPPNVDILCKRWNAAKDGPLRNAGSSSGCADFASDSPPVQPSHRFDGWKSQPDQTRCIVEFSTLGLHIKNLPSVVPKAAPESVSRRSLDASYSFVAPDRITQAKLIPAAVNPLANHSLVIECEYIVADNKRATIHLPIVGIRRLRTITAAMDAFGVKVQVARRLSMDAFLGRFLASYSPIIMPLSLMVVLIAIIWTILPAWLPWPFALLATFISAGVLSRLIASLVTFAVLRFHERADDAWRVGDG